MVSTRTLGGKSVQVFPRVLNATDFGLTADKVAQPSVWNDIMSLTVPAQQAITFGATELVGGGPNGLPAYIALYTSAAAAIEGKIRLVITDANETRSTTILEERTEKLRASQYDRTQAVLLPEAGVYAGQDSKLKIRFYPDSATAVTINYNATNTKVLLPVTVLQ